MLLLRSFLRGPRHGLNHALESVRLVRSFSDGSDNGESGKPAAASAARNTRMGMLAWDAAEELASRFEDGKHDAESMIEVMANAQIRKAMAEGEFDRIPLGQSLAEYESMDPDVRVMKNSGFIPTWIEEGKALRETRERMRASFRVEHDADASKSEARIRSEVDRFNQRVHAHNNSLPPQIARMPFLKAEDECAQARRGNPPITSAA